MTDGTKVVTIAGRRPPNAGKGRKLGTPNKISGSMKEMILGALEQAGGVDWLAKQANENPVAFMGLLSKLLPTDMQVYAQIEPIEPISNTEFEAAGRKLLAEV
jgi:hypothetical protein